MPTASIDEQQKLIKKRIKKAIRDELYERDLSQKGLAEMIGEGESQTNRAINGDNSPKSIKIREKIFKLFNITEV